MFRSALLCLMLALPIAATAQDHADCATSTQPDAELIARLIRWIGTQTDYDITPALARPPTVTFCKTGEIIDYEGHDIRVEKDLRAAFDMPGRTVYLVEPWDAANPFDVSVLLHELIHDIQIANRHWDCLGAPEWEAYKLQDRWLQARGIDPAFNWLVIYMLSRCPRDIHPD